MYDEIIGSISGFTNYLVAFVLYGGFAALSVLQIVSTAKLRSLKKRIQLFLDKSTKGNFEAIRLDYKKIKKFYSITAIAGIAVNFVIWGMKDFWALIHLAPGPIAMFGLLAVLITQLVMGVPMLQLGNLAEQRYRNLYPPVPTTQGFKQLKDEGYVFHADEELFETLGEKDKISENLNLDIFGEGNEELLKYVGGGKAREKQEAAVPQAKEDNTELIACPLCGSLNPVGAESCDFCGTDLLNDEEEPLSSPKSEQGE